MDKEKERVSSHRTAPSSSHKTGAKTVTKTASSHKETADRAAVKSDAAKKVVSKAATTERRTVSNEYSRRSSSDGAKRTTNSTKAQTRRSSGKKKTAKKKNTPQFIKKLPGTVWFLIKLMAVVLFLVIFVSIWTGVTGWGVGDLFSHSVQTVKDWSAMSGKGDSFPITLSGSLSSKQEKLAGGLAVLTDTSLTIYSKNGHTARTQAHYMASPALAAESNYALVYDIGGDRWRLETATETLCTGEAEFDILSAAVSRSGYFALVCAGDKFHSNVSVYNTSGKKIFGWNCANYYITSAALSSSGKRLTICGLNAEGGLLKSAVYVFDVENEKQISLTTFTDELLLDVGYLKSGMAIVVGEQSIITVSKDGETVETAASGNKVTAYDFDYGSGLVYCTSPVEGSSITTITALDTEGRQRFSSEVSCNVTDIAISSDYVCLLSQGFGVAYTIGGKQIEEFDVTVDAKKIEIVKDYAFILCNTVLRRESIG